MFNKSKSRRGFVWAFSLILCTSIFTLGCGLEYANQPQQNKAATPPTLAASGSAPGTGGTASKNTPADYSPIILFYAGIGTDQSSRTLDDVWAFDFAKLESVHNYIQWLFPTIKASAHNAHAPLLTDDDIAFMRANPTIQRNLRLSLKKMVEFYGLKMGKLRSTGELVVVKNAAEFQNRSQWLTKGGNHNFLRITRIIQSLRLLGLETEAQAFFKGLERDVYSNATYKSYIDARKSYHAWKNAAEEGL